MDKSTDKYGLHVKGKQHTSYWDVAFVEAGYSNTNNNEVAWKS